MRVVSRWCRCVVQRLCATDCKHPCLVRAAAPHSAPARMPGVYAQRLCTMQSQQSIHSPSPRGRGLGIGIENLLYFYKYRLFLQTVYISIITENLTQFNPFVYIAQITILKVGNNSLSFFDKKLSNHLIMREKFCIIER